jgi:c(7)-type cytochrome triheme protein
MLIRKSLFIPVLAACLTAASMAMIGNDGVRAQQRPPATAAPAATAPAAPAPTTTGAPNNFNRLLIKKSAKVNAPPAEDGIHDPANPGTTSLQPPSEAFQDLPKSQVGNRVDWVKAIEGKSIQPRFDREDADAEATVFDLDIIREVKGSMPDVVYPHKQHTEWLDCTNCHDEIFIPEKGKNQISMAAILLGQKCGVCHGKVAFPVSDCRRCHSLPKTAEKLKAMLGTQ